MKTLKEMSIDNAQILMTAIDKGIANILAHNLEPKKIVMKSSLRDDLVEYFIVLGVERPSTTDDTTYKYMGIDIEVNDNMPKNTFLIETQEPRE